MEFTRDGSRILAASGLPDYSLTLYDTDTGEQFVGINEKLPSKNLKKMLFNPNNNNVFAVLTDEGLYVYTIERTGEHDNGQLIVSYKLTRKESGKIKASDMIWDKENRIIVADEGGKRLAIYEIRDEAISEIEQKELTSEPLTMLLTQNQIIVSLADGSLKWFEYSYYNGQHNKNSTAGKEVAGIFGKTPQQEITIEYGPFIYMVYNNPMTKIVGTTKKGTIVMIPFEAYCEEDEDEQNDALPGKEGDAGKAKDKPKILPAKLADFLTHRVTAIKELPGSTQAITLTDDGTVCLWETTNMQLLAKLELKGSPNCIEIDYKGEVGFIGCADGCIRIIDLSDRMIMRLVKLVRLYTGKITRIKRSPDNSMLAVCSCEDKGIYFISPNPSESFPIIGYLPLVGKANSIDWLQADTAAPAKLIAILHNSLLVALTPPLDTLRNQILDPKKVPATYCVIDNHMKHLLCSNSGDILITGEDRKIKKYDLPDASFSDIDPRKPASAPAAEFPGHGLELQCWAFSFDGKLLISGGKDGTYQIRMLSSLGQAKEGKSHSVHQGGVTAVAFSPVRNMIYIGGGDGSFMMLNMSKEPLPTGPKTPTDLGEMMKTLDEVEDRITLSEKIVLDKWKEDEEKQKQAEKEKLKERVKQELHSIKEKLRELLIKNESVQDIEKLSREEFLIDKGRKERMLEERDKESIKLRKMAAKENLKNAVLHKRIKEKTWDTMEVQSTGSKSLFTEQIMFNFHIRKQTKSEVDLYNKLANARRLEIKDQIERRAEELMLDKTDFSKESEHYIVNRFPNQPIIQEEVQEKMTASSIPQPLPGDASPSKAAEAETKSSSKVIYKYKRPGMLARAGKKVVDQDDKFGKDKKEEHKEEDIRLTVKQEKKEIEYFRKNWKTLDGYELLYEPYELQTNARKRAQIVFIKEIIRRMKKEFNKDFEGLTNYKSEQISLIKEKNQKIDELLRDLKESFTKFEIKDDKREQPDHILKVEESDIKIPKYLTREERAALEEEKRKEEARLKALQSDTIGRRGIMSMMGGVLECKRELDELEKNLVRQPWMDLPENQMTEAQRQEYTKFRQMEEDLKERKLNQQKAWRQELNKARNEIDELCQKFEERMNKLTKKKHFMQLRIYEQELYIIRLSLSLYEEKLLRDSKDKTENEMKELMKVLEKYEQIKQVIDNENQENSPNQEDEEGNPQPRVQSHEAERRQVSGIIQNVMSDLSQKFSQQYPQEYSSFKEFVEQGREALKRAQEKERKMGMPKDRKDDNSSVFKRSPYIIIDRGIMEKLEIYNPRVDNVFSKLTDENFRELVQLRMDFLAAKKIEQQISNQKEAKESYTKTLELNINNTIADLNAKKLKLDGLINEIIQYEENIEIIVRIKQGQVEISLVEIAPNLEQAVLIKRAVIQDYNKDIRLNANSLLATLKESSKIEKERKKNDWRIKVLDKDIEYLDTCIDTVMQERIGRHPVFKKRDELPMLESEKIKTLEKQVSKLKDNADRRIKAIKAKIMVLQKQIHDKIRENEELEQNARKKEESVKQRMEILDLSSGGGGEEVKQETENKMKIIATKRRLKDVLLQQEEEFMMLSEELNRIREKTFPSFAHIQAKYEYPDEKAP